MVNLGQILLAAVVGSVLFFSESEIQADVTCDVVVYAGTSGGVADISTLRGELILASDAQLTGEWLVSRKKRLYVGNNTGEGDKSAVNGVATNVLNQREEPDIKGRFVSLGRSSFSPDNPAKVLIENRGTTAHVGLDSVRLVPAVPRDPFPLWPSGEVPGASGKAEPDTPGLTPYFPESAIATGAAMVICPGGGYVRLAEHEGEGYARFLNEHGIAAFVLKYRLGSAGYRHPAMLEDAARAVRLVRANAADWGLDPGRIGIMGSSAGGHLASTLLTHFSGGDPDALDPIERQSDRPDLGILCYPVITMGDGTHAGSRANLLGANPSPELIELLSNERHVTAETPPTFLWHTAEDPVVPVSNSLDFAAALAKHGVPFDLHVYEKGAHGLGLGSREYDPAKWHPWTADLLFWLKGQGFLDRIRS